jgi:hypothetical protein
VLYASGRGKYPSPGEEVEWVAPLHNFLFKNTTVTQQPFELDSQWPGYETFFMDSSLIRRRPKEEYIAWRNKLRVWSSVNAHMRPDPAFYCGQLMGWNWHVIFANRTWISFE